MSQSPTGTTLGGEYALLNGLRRTPERLYALLPAMYRIRDAGEGRGESLRALLGVMETELTRVEDDIARLYDNWFIETCDEWVVPYLGDLLGIQPFHGVSQRAFVANALSYRRRKGTLQTLETMAYDITCWPAYAVEYRRLSATVQHVKVPEPEAVALGNLRDAQAMAALGSPFERTPHLFDVRAASRYKNTQLGLFLWRTSAYLIEQAPASVIDAAAGYFHMSPAGHDLLLWSPGDDVGAAANDQGVPQPAEITRRALYEDLEARRQALADGRKWDGIYFAARPLLRVYVAGADGITREIPCEQILIADLDPWWTPASSKDYVRRSDGKTVTLPLSVAVDPERGRIAFPAGAVPRKVWVSYYEGRAAEIGGGGYDRAGELASLSSLQSSGSVVLADDLSQTIDARVAPLFAAGVTSVVIDLSVNERRDLSILNVPAGATLELRCRNFHQALVSTKGATGPCLVRLADGAKLILNGVLLRGAITVERVAPADASQTRTGAAVELRHCTLVPGISLAPDGSPILPGIPSVSLSTGVGGGLSLHLCKCIAGPLRVPGATVTASDTVLDCAGAGRGSASSDVLIAQTAKLSRVTVIGTATLAALDTTVDTLFCEPVSAPGGTSGAVSYSFLPAGSNVPGPVKCQPDVAIAEARAAGGNTARVAAQTLPWFTSRRYGTAGYGLLSPRCCAALRSGGSDEGEIGAMHNLQRSQRAACLSSSLRDYLRFGINLRVIYVS